MKKDNMRLIATVMGEDTIDNRNKEVSSLLDYGYNTYKMQKIYSKNKVLKVIKNDKIKDNNIKIVPTKDIYVLTKKSEKLNPSYKIKIDNIKTNIKKGNKVGTIDIINNKKIINRTNLTVSNDIKKTNIVELYLKYIKDLVSGDMTL